MTRLTVRARLIMLVGLLPFGLYLLLCRLTWKQFTFVEWWREARTGVVLRHAPTSEKIVALTFDDGPDPRYTPRVLAILKRYSIHATFFQEGRFVQQYPTLARSVVAQGHGIGNHTYSHPYLTRMAPADIRKEMRMGADSLRANLGIDTTMFRPPRGDWNPAVFAEARRENNYIILWSVALEHHDAPTPREMAERVLRLVKPGDIILMHDGAFISRETTVQALPLLLEGLRQRGYRFVTVPELLHIPGTQPQPPSY